ncbi:Alpha-galactosidase, partial [hydrothermal vent metagenome]
GVEHPSVECKINNDTLSLSQPLYINVGKEWVDLPPAVFASASEADLVTFGEEGLRHAFIRYLDGVRVKPNDMHVNYNDWWTAPQPSSEAFVLANIDTLKKNLFDKTGFFFDSYAIDEGWADLHSVWEINRDNFPGRFKNISNALESMGSHTGLWISPSSLYPASLDNKWLQSEGYEVTPNEKLGLNACIAIGGRYQTEFKNKLLKYTREAKLGHIKFDGFTPTCDDSTHDHPIGDESYLPLAEGLMDVFDELRKINPNIALEPTCFGYQASPWWLMHVPFIIGPFGDDSPKGRSPSPDWLESMTTARDIRNLNGRDAFLMPSSALQTFDIVVQSPGAFQNHAVMAIGRGRWFISSYINPAFMDADEWQFFADLIAWARDNRQALQEPIPIGGDPELRQAYGYAFRDKNRELYCLRNPWMEESFIDIPRSPMNTKHREVRSLYPRRESIAKVKVGASTLRIHLGPYETKFIEIVPLDKKEMDEEETQIQKSKVTVTWNPDQPVSVTSTTFKDEPKAFGPNWSSPEGDAKEIRMLQLEGELEVKGALQTKLSILCEGQSIKSAFPQVELTIDGIQYPAEISRSVGAFSAGGYTDEDWVWVMVPFPEGKHEVKLKVKAFTNSADFGVFLQGTVKAPESLPPFDSGPSFPLYQPEIINWSRVIVSPISNEIVVSQLKPISHKIDYINGIYLDKLKWISATTGWREVQLNHSIKGQTMTMGGKMFHRGIGTHAYSRIVYKRPEEYDTFAATIGCDQKALVGSLVFVVEGDGKELFRSPIFRADSAPMEIGVPIGNTNEITLIVEDGGDRINADHANWANARFLKTID